jgi:hypothetical protein
MPQGFGRNIFFEKYCGWGWTFLRPFSIV